MPTAVKPYEISPFVNVLLGWSVSSMALRLGDLRLFFQWISIAGKCRISQSLAWKRVKGLLSSLSIEISKRLLIEQLSHNLSSMTLNYCKKARQSMSKMTLKHGHKILQSMYKMRLGYFQITGHKVSGTTVNYCWSIQQCMRRSELNQTIVEGDQSYQRRVYNHIERQQTPCNRLLYASSAMRRKTEARPIYCIQTD